MVADRSDAVMHALHQLPHWWARSHWGVNDMNIMTQLTD